MTGVIALKERVAAVSGVDFGKWSASCLSEQRLKKIVQRAKMHPHCTLIVELRSSKVETNLESRKME